MSRANLSRDYFTNRQDRYMLFSDSTRLADYFSRVAQTIADHSYCVGSDEELRPALEFDHLTSRANSVKYRRIVSDSVRNLLRSEQSINCQSNSGSGGNEEEDTAVFPLLQMGQYGIRQEEEATVRLLAGLSAGERLCLATGYFNLPPRYIQALLGAGGDISVLAASPQVYNIYSYLFTYTGE